MGRVAQLPHHHPKRRAESETDLHRRLGGHDPEKIDPGGLESQYQHQEPQHRDRQLVSRHEVISTRRLEYARDHHRETETRSRHRLKPKKLHDQGVRAGLKLRMGEGPIGHAQERGDLQNRHRRVEIQPARDGPVDPLSVAPGPGIGDLPLQRGTGAELEQELEKTKPPGEKVGPILVRADRLQDQPGLSIMRRRPEVGPVALTRTCRSAGGPEPAAEPGAGNGGRGSVGRTHRILPGRGQSLCSRTLKVTS